MRKISLFLILTILICANALAYDFPKPISWVSDYAGILTNEQKLELDGILREIETTDSTQIFVCIMNKIPEGFVLEGYVNDLFSQWKIGQSKKDNGVLLAVFIQDRKMRIEVGYGLEDRLTDAQSMMIISNEITPAFKSGDYYSGIKKGVQGILASVRGAYQGSPKKQQNTGSEGLGFMMFFILFIIFMIVTSRLKKAGRSIDLGSGMTRRTSGSYRRSSGSRSSSSSSWGGGFSSGGGGFSSGGGGFSGGGGGSSGGGGASGSW
ncbi:MAG: YgcG family protein [Desulfococcaceae bacterium]